jgi:hypothetical protein
MFINIGKAKLCNTKIIALGHEIDGTMHTLAPNKKKLEGLVQFQPPTSVRGVMKVFGLLNYFRKFIPNFATLTKPICKLLGK